MTTLYGILSDFVPCDSSLAIYAKKINGKFKPESAAICAYKPGISATFGEPTGVDDCDLFATNMEARNHWEDWLNEKTFNSEALWANWANRLLKRTHDTKGFWAELYIREINNLQKEQSQCS